MSKSLAKYLFQHGIYSIEEMKELVYQGQITKEEFYDITRKKGTQFN